ncbi:MAG: hypothetical protein R3268_00145 [Acidiferrobacterales bacterium]|nr:hypothetical protein [Acidiferrobacterales bacterium]
MARLKGMMENWTKDGRFFWRDMYCNHVQVYPDIRVPGIDLEPGEIGMSGQGKAWKELLPDFVLHYIRHNGILQREYKKYGWSLP